MANRLLKTLIGYYVFQELVKNQEEKWREKQQEEYDENHNQLSFELEDEEYGGHWETKDGKYDGELFWVESKKPAKHYLVSRYVSIREMKENKYEIKIDFTSDKEALDEYECVNGYEVEAAIKIFKKEYEENGAEFEIIDMHLA